ncbi:MAG: DUF2851 family protein [Prevotella sp.]|nr:DUF2851 family protein [Prevotella sp.]
MEKLLHYVWKHKLLPLQQLETTDGRAVEVIDPGQHNSKDSGPDFFNSKLKIQDTLWVGNVEIHDKASDWHLHGHDHDSAYDNVVLHVVGTADKEVQTTKGEWVPQMVLQVPKHVKDNYEELLEEDAYPPCYRIIPQLPSIMVHSWMASLQTERLEQKTKAIEKRAERKNGDYEAAFFTTLARNYGFGTNGDAFEMWAQNLSLGAVMHHRDSLFQIEAIFMGQAGLLDEETIPERYRKDADEDGYFAKLKSEYEYLAHKFSMTPVDSKIWRFLRMRPQNFPHIRISQLANMYYEGNLNLSRLIECTTIEQLQEPLKTKVTPYWETHYTFGSTSTRTQKNLSQSSINLLMINTAIPMMFAYGRHTMNEELCNRAFDLLEQLKPENNYITRMWQSCGLLVRSAGDSQALIQLKKEYCDKRDCLRCRIGYEYLKRT